MSVRKEATPKRCHLLSILLRVNFGAEINSAPSVYIILSPPPHSCCREAINPPSSPCKCAAFLSTLLVLSRNVVIILAHNECLSTLPMSSRNHKTTNGRLTFHLLSTFRHTCVVAKRWHPFAFHSTHVVAKPPHPSLRVRDEVIFPPHSCCREPISANSAKFLSTTLMLSRNCIPIAPTNAYHAFPLSTLPILSRNILRCRLRPPPIIIPLFIFPPYPCRREIPCQLPSAKAGGLPVWGLNPPSIWGWLTAARAPNLMLGADALSITNYNYNVTERRCKGGIPLCWLSPARRKPPAATLCETLRGRLQPALILYLLFLFICCLVV